MNSRPWLAQAGFALVAGLALALSAVPVHAAVKAWLDSNQVAPGDSVQLTLEYEGQTSVEPDLAPLERDFDVLGTNRATTVEFVNGNTSARTQVVVTLSPKHAGRLLVPSLAWGGERTAALALDVSAGGAGGNGGSVAGGSGAGVGGGSANGGGAGLGGAQPGGAASHARQVFIETEFSPAQPYVQAAVTVTLRLYTREALYNPSITFASSRDVLIQQVGSDQNSTVERGGEPYEVVTRHYLVFPQRSGNLSLPGPVLNAQVALGNPADAALNDPFAGLFGPVPFVGNMLSAVKPIRLHADPITLDVRPRPAGAAGSYWMPASEVTLQSVWHPASLQASAGDPVTVDLSLEATGLTAAQLPDLSQLLELPAGLKAYPDQAKLNDTARGTMVVGTRTQSVALIADQPGRFTIPALRLEWWDTRDNRQREAVLPARSLVVAPAAGSALRAQASSAAQVSAPGAAGASGASGGSGAFRGSGALGASREGHLPAGRGLLWLGVCAALALAWLVTLGAWLRLRNRVPPARSLAGAAAAEEASVAPAPKCARRLAAAEGLAATAGPQRGSTAAPLIPAQLAPAASARAAFRLACRRNDAAGARRHLLAWVRAAWPEPAPTGLNALAKQIEDPSWATLIQALDRACYAGEPWSGDQLGSALADLPRPKRNSADQSADLEPLYR